MKCYLCEGSDLHRRPDIHPERCLVICKTCGNTFFDVSDMDEAKIREYYRKSYRPRPTNVNLVTTTNKLNYVFGFLRDYLEENRGKQLFTTDVGCATGYLVNRFRQLGHKATGCEWTVTFRRFCEHYYNIPITEDIVEKHRYDLISLYHVFEHMLSPDQKLEKYRDLLADGGHILISTPEWMDYLEDTSGPPLKSITQYFHKDHINCFSRKSLQGLFAKKELVIVKQDLITYGQTYLVRRKKPEETLPPLEKFFDDWKLINEIVTVTNSAMGELLNGRSKQAKELWPHFPEAWIHLIMSVNGKDPDKQGDLWQEALAKCGDNFKLWAAYASWLYQRERYQESIQWYEKCLMVRPNVVIFAFLGQCHSLIGDHKTAIKYFNHASVIDPSRWQEMMDWVCKEASSMPTWDEVAMEQFKQEVIEKKKPVFELENTFAAAGVPETSVPEKTVEKSASGEVQ